MKLFVQLSILPFSVELKEKLFMCRKRLHNYQDLPRTL